MALSLLIIRFHTINQYKNVSKLYSRKKWLTFNKNSIYHLKYTMYSDNGRNNSDEIGISGLAAIVVSSLMSQILCWQFLGAQAMHEMSWIPFSKFQWPDACCYLWMKFWFIVKSWIIFWDLFLFPDENNVRRERWQKFTSTRDQHNRWFCLSSRSHSASFYYAGSYHIRRYSST